MTELHDLLTRAAGDPDQVCVGVGVVHDDIARGLRALRRRRLGTAGGVATLAVAVAAAGPSVYAALPTTGAHSVQPAGGGGTGASEQQKAKAAAAGASSLETATKRAALKRDRAIARTPWRSDAEAVPIHTYEGPPVEGSYQVGMLPEGAVVQGGNAYRLTIARAGDPDGNPDSFVGKVVVMLSGRAAPQTPVVESPDTFSTIVVVPLPQPIDGATAFEVQFAPGLGWTDNEALKFATAITVLPSARGPKG